jgi:valyl-tRNA synthetase
VLEGLLRMLHPLMPFITEEIWQSVAPWAGRKGETIMLQTYPTRGDFPHDAAAEAAIIPIKATILGARQIRGQLDVPRSRQMPLYVKTPNESAWKVVQENAALIQFLANVTEIQEIKDEGSLPPTALQLIDGHAVHAPLASLVDDPDAELARLAKRKAKVRQEIAKAEGKLSNQNFVANAPVEVVEQERTRIANFKTEVDQIEEQERRVALLKKK